MVRTERTTDRGVEELRGQEAPPEVRGHEGCDPGEVTSSPGVNRTEGRDHGDAPCLSSLF